MYKRQDILIIGVAYKPNVGDVRESPALDIIHLLRELGANVSYHDPYVPKIHYDSIQLGSVDDPYTAVQMADCIVIVTNHTVYDWNKIQQTPASIIDTRNSIVSQYHPNIISI